MITFQIKGRIPSKKNSLRRIRRGNRTFTIASEQHEIWHKDACIQLLQQRSQFPSAPVEKAKIVILLKAPDYRKGDLTNKAESLMDLLVDNKILSDDNWFVCGEINLKFEGVDKENAGAEIRIYER